MRQQWLISTGNVHLSLLLIRLWLGAMMIYHGSTKLFGGMERIVETVTVKLQLPPLFAWAGALAEFVGGLLTIVGLLTRPAAVLIATTMAVAAFGAHAHDPWTRKEFALCYFVFALVLIVAGAGKYSLDVRLMQDKSE